MPYHKFYRNILGSIILRLSLIYFMYALCRILFYLINYKSFGVLSISEWKNILIGGLVFDTSAIAYTNILFVILWLIPYKPLVANKIYRKSLDVGFITVNLFCLILNVIDFYYFEFNLKRMTADFSHWVGESNLGLILIDFLAVHWTIVLCFTLCTCLLIWLYRKLPFYINEQLGPYSFFFAQLTSIGVCIGLAIAGMRGGFLHSTRPITLSNAGKYVSNPSRMPIVLNTPFSIIRTIDKKPYPDEQYMSEEKAQSIFNPVHQYHVSSDSAASTNKKNVVILILESFSREHSGYLNPDLEGGHYRGFTPFLDSLMHHSIVCVNAFANGRKSIEAMPSILASLPSLVLPYVLSHNSLNRVNSLASLLKNKGYYSAFFHGAPNGSMGFQAFAGISGFDSYYGKDEYHHDEDYDGIWGIWDEEFFQFFGKTLTTFKQPFLGVCFSVSSHHPFILPLKYKDYFDKGKLEVHPCVEYTDYALKQFFNYARSQPWYQNTLFVITADHSTVAWSEKYNSPVGAFAIPIIYYDPSDTSYQTYKPVTQQTDIMPSVLDYLHYDQPFIAFGNSIFDKHSNRFALNYLNEEYQVIDSSQYLSTFNGKEIRICFDIKKSWSPVRENRIDSIPILKNALLFQQAVIQQYNQRILHDQLTIPN
jgi:phosphoglycerol transferase MdoB-like AlkP superfamily enzyme